MEAKKDQNKLCHYYGTLAGMLVAEKRKVVEEQRGGYDWLGVVG